jgi:hypothetical protein
MRPPKLPQECCRLQAAIERDRQPLNLLLWWRLLGRVNPRLHHLGSLSSPGEAFAALSGGSSKRPA